MGDTQQQIEAIERARKRQRAARLRVYESWSYQSIADELGVSLATARAWVREETAVMLPKEETDELRNHQVAKIDDSERTAHLAIQMLKVEAQRRQRLEMDVSRIVDDLRKWQEMLANLRKERATLLGLNLPIKVEHSGKVNITFDEEVESLVSEMLGGGVLMSLPDEVDLDV